MSVVVEAIRDRGVPNQERLVLRAILDVDLADFVVLSSQVGMPEHVIAGSLPSYWFPSRQAQSGDRILLYTGSGEIHEEDNHEGGTDFVFYWNQPSTLWALDGAAVVVLRAESWETTVVDGPRGSANQGPGLLSP